MKVFKLIFILCLAIMPETPSYSYGGPTVNDRNVVPVFVPRFFKANLLKIPSNIDLKSSVLNNIIFKKEGVNISEKLITSYAWRNLQKGKSINLKEAQQNIKNINSLSGIKASAVIEKNSDNSVNLIIQLKNTDPDKGSIRLDNSGSKTTHYIKTTSAFSYSNALNLGETLGLKQTHTMANGTNYYELNSKFFIGDDGSSLAFRAADMRYTHMDYAVATSGGLEGNSNFFDINYLKPVLYEENIGAKLGVGFFRGGFNVFKNSGATEEEDTVNKRLDLSLHVNTSDNIFNKAVTNFRIILSRGKTDLSNNGTALSKSDDPAGVEGYFTKINPAFSRREKINDKNDLLIKFKGQYAFNNLEGSEEFSLGGTYNVRSYPNNESGGDSGFIFTTELEHKFNKDLTTSLVFDYGKIRTVMDPHSGWQSTFYNNQKNEYSLASWGVVADWKVIPGSSIKAQLINRIGSNNQRTTTNSIGSDYDRTKHETKLLLSFTQNF